MTTGRSHAWGLAVCCVVLAAPAAWADQLQAGAASRTLAPQRLVPLAGYGRRGGKPATGVHDEPMVRALVLRQGDTTVALASCDLLIIDEDLFRAVEGRLRAAGFPPATLLIAATHTHSGPGAYGRMFFEKISMGHFDPQVFDFLSGQIAGAIQEAAAQLRPAEVAAGEIPTEGLVKNRVVEGGPVDDVLRLVMVSEPGQPNPIAVVASFAAHPTTLGAWNRQLSADYPGVLARAVEAKYPGAACLFFAGDVGDQAPVKEGDGFGRADRIGQPLAQSALAWLETAQPRAGAALAARQETMTLPVPRVRLGPRAALPGWMSRRLVDDDATLTVVSIGPAVLIGVPCDMSVELGRLLQQHAAKGTVPVVVGFTNDYIGYCMSPSLYASGAYEALMAFNGPDTGLLIVDALKRLMDELGGGNEEAATGTPPPVVYLSGSPYEIGYQHGTQLREEVRRTVSQVLGRFRRYVKIPGVRALAVNWWLDRPWRQAKPFIPTDYLQELQGLADGSGVSVRDLWRFHAVPDRTYSCSGFAAWGRATQDGRLIHTRNLDWNIDVGIQDHAVVFVVKPAGKHAFVNLGWAGFIGVLTGISDRQISIGEVGAETTDVTYAGLPMAFLMRRVLEESDDLDDAVRIVREAPRTIGANYLIADAQARRAVALETTHSHFAVFEANDPKEQTVSYARPMADAVFRADTAVDPAIRDCQLASGGRPREPGLEPPTGSAYETRYVGQSDRLTEHYGQVDEERAKEIARAVAPPSNVQSVVFAWPQVWIANAQGTTPAARTPYYRFEPPELFTRR